MKRIYTTHNAGCYFPLEKLLLHTVYICVHDEKGKGKQSNELAQ